MTGLTPIQHSLVDALSTLMLFTALLIVELKRLDSSIRCYVAQASLLVAIFVTLGFRYPWFFWWSASATVTKVVLAPKVMMWALRKARYVAELEEPLIPTPLSIASIITIYVVSAILAYRISLSSHALAMIGVPPLATAIALILVGLFAVTTRRNALKQVLGIVMFENGSHVMLACAAFYVPETVEIGIATDAIVMVAIMSVLAYLMARIRGDMDVSKLVALRY